MSVFRVKVSQEYLMVPMLARSMTNNKETKLKENL